MIKKPLICILLVTFVTTFLLINYVFASASKKKEEYLGAGIILGTPNGLALKYYLNDMKALDVAIGSCGDQVELHSNYLWHLHGVIANPSWVPYVGSGLTLRMGGSKNERQQVGTNPKGKPIYENISVDKETLFALRGDFGILFKYRKWEPFLELVPLLVITPKTELDIDISIGVRYYFK